MGKGKVSAWIKKMPLWTAVVVGAVIILGIAAGAFLLLTNNFEPSNRQPSLLDLVRLSLTLAAGFGGLVALVVAYRRQKDHEDGRFIERFGAAAAQLGHTDVAIRMAGVYAMAGTADRTHDTEQRQQCIDVLCGYLRLPYSCETGNNHQVSKTTQHGSSDSAASSEEWHFQYRQNDREVRQTIIRVIASHLIRKDQLSWSKHDLDFTGAHLEEANFEQATFSGENTIFKGTTFSGEATSFADSTFDGEKASFIGATFKSKGTWFIKTTFNSEHTWFNHATFSDAALSFADAKFTGRSVSFYEATFSDKNTSFSGTSFSGFKTDFTAATFSSEYTSFNGAAFSAEKTSFLKATFSGEKVSFDEKRLYIEGKSKPGKETSFSGKNVMFNSVTFSGKHTLFRRVSFTCQNISFRGATFSGKNTGFRENMFSGKETSFLDATFRGDNIIFRDTTFGSQGTSFESVSFNSSYTLFRDVTFDGKTSFEEASFGTGIVLFEILETPTQGDPNPKFDWAGEESKVDKPDNVTFDVKPKMPASR